MRPILLFSVLAVIAACSTKVDVNTEYREIPVIYGFLDYQLDTQYIKVNKAFTNEGSDANVIAATQPDSTTYGDEGEVFLIKGIDTTQLQRIMVTNKAPGLFFNPNQELYIYTAPLGTGNCKIFFRNTLTGTTASVATPIVHSSPLSGQAFTILNPTPNFDTINLARPDRTLFPNNFSIIFRQAVNGFQYTVDINMVVRDLAPTGTITREIPWRLTGDLRSAYNGGTVTVRYAPKDFVDRLLAALPVNTGYQRYFDYFTITISVATQEYTKYMDVAGNFSPISQTKPIYTNVQNGLGLLASRASISRNIYFYSTTHQYLIDEHPQYGFRQPL